MVGSGAKNRRMAATGASSLQSVTIGGTIVSFVLSVMAVSVVCYGLFVIDTMARMMLLQIKPATASATIVPTVVHFERSPRDAY